MKKHLNVILSTDEIYEIIKWIHAQRKLIYDGIRTGTETEQREGFLDLLEDKLTHN